MEQKWDTQCNSNGIHNGTEMNIQDGTEMEYKIAADMGIHNGT